MDDDERRVTVSGFLEGEDEEIVAGLTDVQPGHDGSAGAAAVGWLARPIGGPHQHDGAFGLGDGLRGYGSDDEAGDDAEPARADGQQVGVSLRGRGPGRAIRPRDVWRPRGHAQ